MKQAVSFHACSAHRKTIATVTNGLLDGLETKNGISPI
jgi:hypothetical protein